MTCQHLKKIKVFSNLHRPETQLRLAQGHQRAHALTGSINIFQGTISTVYETEYQKTLKEKLGKHFLWFSQVIKDFYHYFQEKKSWKTQKDKMQSYNAFPKLINRYHKLLWLKSTSRFKEQTRIPLKLKIEKI